MSAILPGTPPGFDRKDVGETVKELCNYLRPLQENVDFQLSQSGKREGKIAQRLESLEKRCEELLRRMEALEEKQSNG